MTTSVSSCPAPNRKSGAVPPPIDLLVRPIEPGDAIALQRFYSGMSEESRRLRFLSVSTRFGEKDSRYLCGPDHEHREGFVAVARSQRGASDPAGPIIGHVCIEPFGSEEMEIAIAVADRYQGRGIGHRLVDEALGWAVAHGIERVWAWSAWDNRPIRRLFESLHRPLHYGTSSGAVETVIELQPLPVTSDAA
jgi:GNAT superfamily N-acetyltransferase